MNFNAQYDGPCQGRECQASGSPKNIKDAWIGAKIYRRCNRCYRLDYGPQQRGTTVQSMLERGEKPMRPVKLYEYSRGDHGATASSDI